MMSFKRIMGIALSVVMTVSLFAGCGKEDTKNDEASNSSVSSQSTTQEPKVTWENAPKVVVVRANDIEVQLGKTGDDITDNDYVRYIFEKTGVRLEEKLFPAKMEDFKQKLAIELAGGNQVDLLSFWSLQQDWMDTGTIIKVNELIENNKDSIPNIINNVTEDGWKASSKMDDKWGFPVRNEFGQPHLRGLFLRKDWMDKLGLQVPKTIDDLTNIFKAFTENDPDGNGVKDTYGIGVGKGISSVGIWFHMFGADTWREEILPDNKLIPYGHTERYRNALKVAGEWIQSGWADVEGFTDATISEKKLRNGKIGARYDMIQTMAKDIEVMTANGINDAKWIHLDESLVNPYDNKTYGFTAKQVNAATITMVTAAAKEENYPNILKLLDWMYSEEGTSFLDYGIEGKEHKIVDGKKKKDPQYINKDLKSYLDIFALGKSYKHVNEPEFFVNSYDQAKELVSQYVEHLTTKADKLYWVPGDVKFNYPQLEEFKLYPDYRKVIGEDMGKFLMGEKDPMNDADWNAYLAESEKYGFQKLLDAAAKLYFK